MASNHGSHDHPEIPLATYFKVIVTLLILTAITVAAAQVNFGPWNTVIAMLIASVKASFVLAFFMHLKYDNKLFLVIFLTSIFFLAVLYAFSDIDILTRVHVNGIL